MSLFSVAAGFSTASALRSACSSISYYSKSYHNKKMDKQMKQLESITRQTAIMAVLCAELAAKCSQFLHLNPLTTSRIELLLPVMLPYDTYSFWTGAAVFGVLFVSRKCYEAHIRNTDSSKNQLALDAIGRKIEGLRDNPSDAEVTLLNKELKALEKSIRPSLLARIGSYVPL